MKSDKRFYEILEDLAELHRLKGQDYGTEVDSFANIRASQEFGIPPWVGAIVRGNDKMSRIKTFINKKTLNNESVKDSLLDLAVYAIIALVLFEEEQPKPKPITWTGINTMSF